MLILGIETSCDETAAAVVEDGRRVRSNIVATQLELHAEYGGVVPEIASRAHVERMIPTVRAALAAAGVSLGDCDGIAVGNRPGLIGSLLVGVAAAKALAWSLASPIIGVDHVRAHLYSGELVANSDRGSGGATTFPALGLVISGGHTSLYLLRSWTEIERLGGTIDDAVGEAFDKAATVLGLPHPGGPNLERLAVGGNDRVTEFPVSRLGPDSLDFSFSGLKTSLLYEVRGVPGRDEPKTLTDAQRADLAASFQRAACRALILKVERGLRAASERCGAAVRSLLVGGGVTANGRIRRELAELAAIERVGLLMPPMEYCTDNAAMIAGYGHELFLAGGATDLSLQAFPSVTV